MRLLLRHVLLRGRDLLPGVRDQEGQAVERRHTLDVRACADKVQGHRLGG